MDEKLKIKIQFEISQIDKLISEAEPLLLVCSEREPDFIERAALASILHSFYNGVESIFVLIAKNIDNQLPKDDRWHKTLLDNMFHKTNSRSMCSSRKGASNRPPFETVSNISPILANKTAASDTSKTAYSKFLIINL